MGQATVFRNVRIFDGSRVLDDDTVIIQDGIITAMGRDLEHPFAARIVDGSGFTLLPGLIDAHTHTFRVTNLRQALIFGVTTELDMGTYWKLAQQTKELQQTADGQDLADLRSARTQATAPGGHGTEYGFPIPTITEPEDAQAFMDARLAEGSDYIKIMYDNGSLKASGPEPTLRKETMAALIEAAHLRGKRTVVHILKLQDARDAIELGADGIAHVFVDQPPDEDFASFAAAHHIFVVPTLAILEYVCNVAEEDLLVNHPALSPYLSATDKTQLLHSHLSFNKGTYSIAEEAVRQLKAVGVPLLAGTDAALNTVHGVSLHRELELLVKAGLTPLEALASATSIPARIFDLPDRGRIIPGLRADLLLVEGDPTTDILSTRSITAVWKQGVEVDRQAYRRHLRQQELGDTILQEVASINQTGKR